MTVNWFVEVWISIEYRIKLKLLKWNKQEPLLIGIIILLQIKIHDGIDVLNTLTTLLCVLPHYFMYLFFFNEDLLYVDSCEIIVFCIAW